MEQSPMHYRFLGVLPYAYDDNGELHYLLGEESADHEEDAYLWGTFGGSPDQTDLTLYHGAARECYEESIGFLGSAEEILEKLLQTDKIYVTTTAVIFGLKVEYNVNLPKTYQEVYNYCQKCISRCPEGWFEKSAIAWFTQTDILEKELQMRPKFAEFCHEHLFKND